MAGIPLNTFRTVKLPLTTSEQVLYVTNTGLTAIVLMAQAATTTSASATVTFRHYRPATPRNLVSGSPPDAGDTDIIVIVNQAIIPPNDSLILLSGKLVLETFDYVTAQCSTNNVHFIGSVLETANQ